MISGYLSLLDALLLDGKSLCSGPYIDKQIDWLVLQQQDDGGFAGRMGGSDLYYTDFAVRLTALLAPENHVNERAAHWLRAQPLPGDVIGCFGMLNAARNLERAGISVPLDYEALANRLAVMRQPNGMFARPGSKQPSAYYTFLGALSLQMLDHDPTCSIQPILRLQQPSGGFSDSGAEAQGQTNATAAAMGVMTIMGETEPDIASRACRFIGSMQCSDGGWFAHPLAPTSDLLSTFTALWTLLALGEESCADIANVGRYIASLSTPDGGFTACFGDTEVDVEYSFYGLASLLLLRAYVQHQSQA